MDCAIRSIISYVHQLAWYGKTGSYFERYKDIRRFQFFGSNSSHLVLSSFLLILLLLFLVIIYPVLVAVYFSP